MTAKPTLDAKRKKAERRGRWSEYQAALYLLLKGYRIVALRHKTKWGEVDIIARRGAVVAFVEVKARATRQLAIDAVGYESQRRIRAAGDVWLSKQSDAARLSLRCDIIAIVPRSWPFHLKDAF